MTGGKPRRTTKDATQKPRRGRDPGYTWSVEALCDQVARTGTVLGAAKAIGIDVTTVYRRARKEPEILDMIAEARVPAAVAAEDTLADRAVHGWDEVTTVETMGPDGEMHVVERRTTRKWNSTPAIVIAKAAAPHRYIERAVVDRLMREGAGDDIGTLADRLEAFAKGMRESVEGPLEATEDE